MRDRRRAGRDRAGRARRTPRVQAYVDHTDIGAQVSVDEVEVHNEGGDGATVALVDCGAKGSIAESLVERDAEVHVFPYDATEDDVAAVDPDLLFISNGPGDPENFEQAGELVEPTSATCRSRASASASRSLPTRSAATLRRWSSATAA